jgi:hypothetical protein
MAMRIQAAAVGMAMVLAACGHQAQSAPPPSKLEQAVAGTTNRVIAASVDPDPRVEPFSSPAAICTPVLAQCCIRQRATWC